MPVLDRRRAREIAGRAALALGSVAVALALAEGALRAFLPGDAPLTIDIYRFDEHGLLGMQPRAVRRHRAREWDVRIAIDGDGLRDRADPVPDVGGTVVALGDSFAFGWGVELEDTFLHRIEESLRPRRIRVVKAGIPGTGTTDQLRWLETHGDRYTPKVAVVAFYVGNDFTDVHAGGVPGQFTVADGLLVRREHASARPSPLRRASDHVLRSSLLAQRLAQAAWAWKQRRRPQDRENPGLRARDPWLAEFFQVHLKAPPDAVRAAEREVDEALGGIAAWCAARGARPVLLAVPRSFQVYEWELERWLTSFGLDRSAVDLDRPQRVLGELAAARGMAYCDPLPALRRFDASHPGERLFFYPDAHLAATGHRVVGQELGVTLAAVLP